MRAVLFSAGDWPGIAPLNERQPAPLLPLLDRPFLQHVIEHLAGQKITRLDLVLSHLPEKIEHFVGDGKRWGCQVAFHLARDPERPYRQLKTMSLEEAATEPILLGHADQLPVLDLPGVDAASVAAGPLAYCWRKLHAG